MIQAYVAQAQATLLYVTHSIDEAQAIGGRLVRIERGRIIAS